MPKMRATASTEQRRGYLTGFPARLSAYRAGIDVETLGRTLWRGQGPKNAEAALRQITALPDRIDSVARDALLAGALA